MRQKPFMTTLRRTRFSKWASVSRWGGCVGWGESFSEDGQSGPFLKCLDGIKVVHLVKLPIPSSERARNGLHLKRIYPGVPVAHAAGCH